MSEYKGKYSENSMCLQIFVNAHQSSILAKRNVVSKKSKFMELNVYVDVTSPLV